jgi:hypothetical protein
MWAARFYWVGEDGRVDFDVDGLFESCEDACEETQDRDRYRESIGMDGCWTMVVWVPKELDY